jgi:hypothetical protein
MEYQKQSHHPRWPYAVAAFVLLGSLISYRFKTHESPASTSKSPAVVEGAQVAVRTAAPQAGQTAKADNYAWLGNTDIDQAVHNAKGLKLTPAQLEFMQSRYNVFQDQLKQLEARLAQKEIIKPGETLITIPPHAEAAKALYAQFETEMIAYLGADAAGDFFNEAGPTLAMLNADFGAQEHQILVDKNADIYHIVDKVAYTTVPGLPAGVTTNGVTKTMTSDLVAGTDMLGYRYLAADFP